MTYLKQFGYTVRKGFLDDSEYPYAFPDHIAVGDPDLQPPDAYE
jgi:hypothetical protein